MADHVRLRDAKRGSEASLDGPVRREAGLEDQRDLDSGTHFVTSLERDQARSERFDDGNVYHLVITGEDSTNAVAAMVITSAFFEVDRV